MKKEDKYKKILEKAIELCMKSDMDELCYGNSYLEIGNRSIILVDPKGVTINQKKDKFYGKGLIEPVSKKFKDAVDDFVDLIELEKVNKYGIDDLIEKAKKLRRAHLREHEKETHRK